MKERFIHTSADDVVSKVPYLMANRDSRHPPKSCEVRVGFASMEPPSKSRIYALVREITHPKENAKVFPTRSGELALNEKVVKGFLDRLRATHTWRRDENPSV